MKAISGIGIEVVTCAFDELPFEAPKIGLTGTGNIVVYHDGNIVNVFSDAMEPEDATFKRDLAWVAAAIQDAYNQGCMSKNQRQAAHD